MDTQMPRMHENLSAAQQHMDGFRVTTNSKARRKLVLDHMQSMQDG